MGVKPLSVVAFELGDLAAQRIASWRQSMMLLAGDGMHGIRENDPLGQELRGAAVVAAMAELERLLRELLIVTSQEINQASVAVRDLKPALRALATQSHFQSIMQSPNGDGHWQSRAFVTTLEYSTEIAQLPKRSSVTPQPPLDGRTIRPSHIQRIWTTLGLEGVAIPKPEIHVSLTALATMRNDVAHGNAPIGEVFHPDIPGKSPAEIQRHLQNIEHLIDHVCLTFHYYGLASSYRNVQTHASPATTVGHDN